MVQYYWFQSLSAPRQFAVGTMTAGQAGNISNLSTTAMDRTGNNNTRTSPSTYRTVVTSLSDPPINAAHTRIPKPQSDNRMIKSRSEQGRKSRAEKRLATVGVSPKNEQQQRPEQDAVDGRIGQSGLGKACSCSKGEVSRNADVQEEAKDGKAKSMSSVRERDTSSANALRQLLGEREITGVDYGKESPSKIFSSGLSGELPVVKRTCHEMELPIIKPTDNKRENQTGTGAAVKKWGDTETAKESAPERSLTPRDKGSIRPLRKEKNPDIYAKYLNHVRYIHVYTYTTLRLIYFCFVCTILQFQ